MSRKSIADTIDPSEFVLFIRQSRTPTEQSDLPAQYRCVHAFPEGSIMEAGGRMCCQLTRTGCGAL
jgi:hypothetical protein